MLPLLTATSLSKTFRREIKASKFSERLRRLINPVYEDITAVDSIDFSINRWESVAFLGPNGAGKSTSIKMFTGILTPSSGSVQVCGLNPSTQREELAYRIGAVFGQISRLWYHLTPEDTFDLLRVMYRVDIEAFKRRKSRLVEAFAITDFMNTPVRKLSLGQRMRCEVTAALLHSPEIIFLDEPTIGLDMIAKSELRKVIRQLNREEGVTVLLTSHDMGDVEEVCDRVAIVNHGRIVHDGLFSDLRAHVTHKRFRARFIENTHFSLPSEAIIEYQDERSIHWEIPKEKLSLLLAALGNAWELEDLAIEDLSTEEIIKTFY